MMVEETKKFEQPLPPPNVRPQRKRGGLMAEFFLITVVLEKNDEHGLSGICGLNRSPPWSISPRLSRPGPYQRRTSPRKARAVAAGCRFEKNPDDFQKRPAKSFRASCVKPALPLRASRRKVFWKESAEVNNSQLPSGPMCFF